MLEKYRIDMLTETSVSIVKTKFITVDGEEYQVGGIHRKAYVNSIEGRIELVEEVPQAQVNSVFAVWGENPTIE